MFVFVFVDADADTDDGAGTGVAAAPTGGRLSGDFVSAVEVEESVLLVIPHAEALECLSHPVAPQWSMMRSKMTSSREKCHFCVTPAIAVSPLLMLMLELLVIAILTVVVVVVVVVVVIVNVIVIQLKLLE